MKSNFKITSGWLQKSIVPEIKQHSDGAVSVQFATEWRKADNSDESLIFIHIRSFIKDSAGLLALPSIVNKLRDDFKTSGLNQTNLRIKIQLPYVPYARQDRYTGNNAFTFKHTVLPLLVGCGNVSSWTFTDVHSDAVKDLLKSSLTGVQFISQPDLIALHDLSDSDYLVAPDAGAVQRVQEYVKIFEHDPSKVITLSKTREPNTGRISFDPLVLPEGVELNRVIMFDDIGDGCWTHILAAKALKEAGATYVTLVLTHGVFSKGVDHLYPHIDRLIVGYDWREKQGLDVEVLHKY